MLAELDKRLAESRDKLAALNEKLDILNSSFPATQDFLRARGLTRVSQLDASGREQLERYLLSVLAKYGN